MTCSQCNHIRKSGLRCRLLASCKLGCGLYCWIHAGEHIIGDLCEDFPDDAFVGHGDERRQLERLQKHIQQMYDYALEWEERMEREAKKVPYRKSI